MPGNLQQGTGPPSAVRIKRIRALAELDALEGSWTRLERLDRGPTVFQSWLWNRTWCEHVLNTLKRASLDVRVVEDGAGRILAILPFFEVRSAGPAARLIQFLGHRMSYHNDVLLAEPGSAELADEVVRALLGNLGPRTVLHLRHLDADSAFTKQLLARKIAEIQCTRLLLHRDPKLTDPHARLGRSNQKRDRWAENHLRRNFGSVFRVSSSTDFADQLERLIDLHHLRFASMSRTSLFVGPALDFLRDATLQLSRGGRCEIVHLAVDARPIASALMIRDRHRYFCIQTGFDPDFGRFSPMRLLITETIRRGFEDLHCHVYDLGPGYEAYKFAWRPAVGNNYFCSYGGPGLPGKLLGAIHGYLFRRAVRRATTAPRSRKGE